MGGAAGRPGGAERAAAREGVPGGVRGEGLLPCLCSFVHSAGPPVTEREGWELSAGTRRGGPRPSVGPSRTFDRPPCESQAGERWGKRRARLGVQMLPGVRPGLVRSEPAAALGVSEAAAA